MVYTCWYGYWQRSIQLCLSIFNAISTTFYAISAGIDPLSQPKNPVEFDNIDWILAEIDPLQSPPKKKFCWIWQYLLNLTWHRHRSILSVYPKILSNSTILCRIRCDIGRDSSTSFYPKFCQIWCDIGRDWFLSVYPKIPANSTISIQFDLI